MVVSNQLLGKRVLVTGASGFIGSHLCNSLCSNGAEVHATYRTLNKPQSHSSIYWWKVDLQDFSSTQTALNTIKPDIIYHLASHVTGSRAMEHIFPTLYNNFISTVNLLKLATEIGCSRIVLAGSLEEPELHDAAIFPSSPYAAAKWASSTYARMFHDLYQTPVVIARIFMVYGPGQATQFLIPYVINSLLAGKSPQLTSGKRPIDWIYVDDLVSGLICMASKPNLEGQTIDLGSGELITIREVVQQLISIINPQIVPLFGAIPDRPGEQIRTADSKTSYLKLNWKTKIPLEEGLKLTAKWYEKYLETLGDELTASTLVEKQN